jgi:hypothetical protein
MTRRSIVRGYAVKVHLRVSCHQLFALIQRQAESFGDREIVAVNPRHLRLRRDTRLKFGDQPRQLAPP